MPELPEVETVVRTLRPQLVGARLAALETSGLKLRLARAIDERTLRAVAVGGRVAGVRRRGKYVLIDIADGRGVVLVHLGMTGRLSVRPAGEARPPHTHVVLATSDGRELRFVDPRRFGWIRAAKDEAGLEEIAGLGPDPLAGLDPEALADALAGSRAPIKAFLLDQRRMAGVGNIYACEALYRARIHPTTPAHRARGRAVALAKAIREVLELGVRNRGTTLRDYVDADGAVGDNAAALSVYGREGEPCRTCGAPIKRRVDAGRSTFYCGRCQRR